MKIINLKTICLPALYMLVFATSVFSAGKKNLPDEKIDIYKYWPWTAGTTWEGTKIKKGWWELESAFAIKSLGPSKDAEIQVLWPGGWLDHYKETDKGLERPKDFQVSGGNYGVYTPPAIQYPHYIKLGEIYRRTARRNDYSGKDGRLLGSADEEMSFVALGFEDVTVPAGRFQDCLMQMRNYRTIGGDGIEHRKIVITWNAKNVGTVRGCLTEFRGGKMVDNFCAQLRKWGKEN